MVDELQKTLSGTSLVPSNHARTLLPRTVCAPPPPGWRQAYLHASTGISFRRLLRYALPNGGEAMLKNVVAALAAVLSPFVLFLQAHAQAIPPNR